MPRRWSLSFLVSRRTPATSMTRIPRGLAARCLLIHCSLQHVVQHSLPAKKNRLPLLMAQRCSVPLGAKVKKWLLQSTSVRHCPWHRSEAQTRTTERNELEPLSYACEVTSNRHTSGHILVSQCRCADKFRSSGILICTTKISGGSGDPVSWLFCPQAIMNCRA